MLPVEPGEETRKQESDFLSRFKEGRSALDRWQLDSWKSQLLLFISAGIEKRDARFTEQPG